MYSAGHFHENRFIFRTTGIKQSASCDVNTDIVRLMASTKNYSICRWNKGPLADQDFENRYQHRFARIEGGVFSIAALA